MSDPLRKFEAEALALPEKDRAELARVLILSLEDPQEDAIERIWAEEADRRYQELKAGTEQPIPSIDVFADARSRRQ
jgi:putative addiction module component (TIGR02574 family)